MTWMAFGLWVARGLTLLAILAVLVAVIREVRPR
jgi:hypothetical protein